jgi:predicted metalloendopeptidase
VLVSAPFAFGAQPDPHGPTRTVADIGAGGLGLPDRDYYLKPEPRFADARERTYLKWRLLASAAPSLSRPLVEESFAFNQKCLGGVSELKPRWKRCAESTDFRLGEALGRKYVERYFPPAAKARVQQLVRNELAAMKEIIEGLPWMGPETKRRARLGQRGGRPQVRGGRLALDHRQGHRSRTR